MKLICLILAVISSVATYGQENVPFNFSLMSGNQQLINDAVRKGFVIMSHSYQLEDTTTHQRFGRYGKNEFGTGYSVGIKIPGGIITTDKFVTPWEYDINYQKYRGSHSPISYQISHRALGDSVFTLSKSNISLQTGICNNNLSLLPDSTLSFTNSFSVDSVAGNKDGWLVWIVSDSQIGDKASANSESLIIHKYSYTEKSDSVQTLIKSPNTDKNIWGGVLVTPIYPSVGEVRFLLSGVLSEVEAGEWILNMLKINTAKDSGDVFESDLTPVESVKTDLEAATQDESAQNGKQKKKSKKKNKKNG